MPIIELLPQYVTAPTIFEVHDQHFILAEKVEDLGAVIVAVLQLRACAVSLHVEFLAASMKLDFVLPPEGIVHSQNAGV
jgi:hypothetical protein